MVCKNCNNSLKETDDYCNNCGAKVIRNRLTIKNLFEHIIETFFNYDNKLLRTFINLFTNPEIVIGGYLDGVRKKYVNVISYFALALTFSGLQIFILNKFFPESINLSTISTNGMEDLSDDILGFTFEYYSILMMLYIPLYAILSKLTFFKNKKYNYTEHLVVFMYVLAQINLITVIITIGGVILGFSFGSLSFSTLALQFFYTAYCLKRLYKLSLKGIILRSLLFLAILFIIYIISIILIMVFAVAFKPEWFEQIMEAQKASQ